MTLLLLYLALAVGVSFLCSIMEAVLLSITPSYVAALEDEDPAAGGRIRELKEDIDRPLAAILTLNTFAHTLGAAGAGAQATIVFGNAYIGAFSVVLTLIILVASKIIPKTLGAVYWRQLASPVARLLKPTIWILQEIADRDIPFSRIPLFERHRDNVRPQERPPRSPRRRPARRHRRGAPAADPDGSGHPPWPGTVPLRSPGDLS